MAVSSKFTQKSLFGGGSTKSNTPKIDISYGANLGSGQQQNNIVKLPTLLESNDTSNFAVTNKNTTQNLIGETLKVTIPKYLTYQNNLDNVANFIGQGGSNKGITDEGVIIGNPNVENMPTINREEVTSKPLVSYNDQLLAAAENIELPVSVQQTHSFNSNSGFPTEVIGGTNQDETLGIPMIGNNHTETGSVTDSTDITGDSGLGGTTTSGNKVDTYEEFLLKQEGFYKEQLDKLNAQIEQNKQNALQQAESERERAVIDARSSYAQNLATYGANAEQLAAMGLSGSGYSDYLNQQAYATQRAETQNANAQAEATKLAAEQQANSDKLNAELSYAENMQGNAEKLAQYQQQKAEEAKAEEEQKKQYYAALLTSANTGEYTSEQIASLGAQYGLDEAQISQLQAAADKYKSDQQSLSYTEALQMISDYGADLDVSYLETLLNTGSVSQEQYDQLMAQYSKELIESGDLANEDTDKIDDLHQSGQISEEDYNKQKEQWNSQIDTSDAFFNSGSMSASEAKKQLDKILNNEWTSEENKKALQKTYDSLYKVVTNDVRFNNDGGWWIFGSTDMDDVGNNFSLIDNSGFKYRVKSGGKVTDSAITSIARDVADGSIFGLRGQIYYKKDGNVYLVRKRENSYGDHYTKLYNKFFG